MSDPRHQHHVPLGAQAPQAATRRGFLAEMLLPPGSPTGARKWLNYAATAVMIALAVMLLWAGLHKLYLIWQGQTPCPPGVLPADCPRTGIDAAELINAVHQSLFGIHKEGDTQLFPAEVFLLVVGMAEMLVGMFLLLSAKWKRWALLTAALWIAAATTVALLAHPNLAGKGCGCLGTSPFGMTLDVDNLRDLTIRNAVIVLLCFALIVVWTPRRGTSPESGGGKGGAA
jgi:hypothetical protein